MESLQLNLNEFSLDSPLGHFLTALAGGITTEALYWREIYQTRKIEQFQEMLGSKIYWLFTLAFILGAAICSLAINSGGPAGPRQYLIAAAAVGPFIKSGGRSLPGRKLGRTSSAWKTYLGVE